MSAARRPTLLLGAVAYDPKVVTIWEGFQRHFAEHELSFDFVLYTSYERQVEAHFAGHFDVAWNSPLAWVETVALARRRGRDARAIAMRDTDRDLTSVVLVRSDSEVTTIAGLAGRRIGVGARDSPQATLLPLLHLAEAGLEPHQQCEVVSHDVLVGKHGDHVGGERDAVRALVAGEVEAACVIDGNHLAFAREGTLPPGAARVLCRTAPFDHCNFTVLDGAPAAPVTRFADILLAMQYEDPAVRPLMDLEGLRAWHPGRTTGYAALERAARRFGFLDEWVESVGDA